NVVPAEGGERPAEDRDLRERVGVRQFPFRREEPGARSAASGEGVDPFGDRRDRGPGPVVLPPLGDGEARLGERAAGRLAPLVVPGRDDEHRTIGKRRERRGDRARGSLLARAKASKDDDATPRGSGARRRDGRPDLVGLEVSDDANPVGRNSEESKSLRVLLASRERVDTSAEVALAGDAEGPEAPHGSLGYGRADEDDGHAGASCFVEEVGPDLRLDHVDPKRRGLVEKRAEEPRQVGGREARRGDVVELSPRPREPGARSRRDEKGRPHPRSDERARPVPGGAHLAQGGGVNPDAARRPRRFLARAGQGFAPRAALPTEGRQDGRRDPRGTGQEPIERDRANHLTRSASRPTPRRTRSMRPPRG